MSERPTLRPAPLGEPRVCATCRHWRAARRGAVCPVVGALPRDLRVVTCTAWDLERCESEAQDYWRRCGGQ